MNDSKDPTTRLPAAGDTQVSEADIDEALGESFPASDPPFWTLGTRSTPTGKPTTKADDDHVE